jgi:hypothetical protein
LALPNDVFLSGFPTKIKFICVSSGSIVSDYGQDDRAIGVWFPAEANNFSSNLCVQTGSGAHPASCIMGTGGKARPGRNADHSPHLVPRPRMSRSYIYSPPKHLHGVLWDSFNFSASSQRYRNMKLLCPFASERLHSVNSSNMGLSIFLLKQLVYYIKQTENLKTRCFWKRDQHFPSYRNRKRLEKPC